MIISRRGAVALQLRDGYADINKHGLSSHLYYTTKNKNVNTHAVQNMEYSAWVFEFVYTTFVIARFFV